MRYHYENINGRTLDHALVQALMLTNNCLFDILNSIVFVSLIVLMLYHSYGTFKAITAQRLLMVYLLLFFIVPVFGECFLWHTGSCNYLWSLVLVLICFVPVTYCIKHTKSTPKNIVKEIVLSISGALLGFLAGATNEVQAACFCAMLFLAIIYNRYFNHIVRPWLIVEMVFAFAGLLSIVVSPGQLKRLSEVEHKEIYEILKGLLYSGRSVFEKLYPLLLIVAFGFVLTIINNRIKRLHVVRFDCIFIFGGILGVFLSIIGGFPERTLTSSIVFLIISGCSLYNDRYSINIQKSLKIGITSVLLIGFIVTYPAALLKVKKVNNRFINREQQIHAQLSEGKDVLILPSIWGDPKYSIEWGDLVEDPTEWPNTAIAKYYGVKEIINENTIME